MKKKKIHSPIKVAQFIDKNIIPMLKITTKAIKLMVDTLPEEPSYVETKTEKLQLAKFERITTKLKEENKRMRKKAKKL